MSHIMKDRIIARLNKRIEELEADNARLRAVIYRNCDPMQATPEDAKVILAVDLAVQEADDD